MTRIWESRIKFKYRINRWIYTHPIFSTITMTLLVLVVALVFVVWIADWLESRFARQAPAIVSWKTTGHILGCKEVGKRTGAWLTLECSEEHKLPLPTKALLAGFSLAPGTEEGSKHLEASLRDLLPPHDSRGNHVRPECELIIVEGSNHSLPFARCWVKNGSLSLLLITAGALPSPPRNSAAWASLSGEDRARLELLTPPPHSEDRIRSSLVPIQTWVATLVGFLGASASFVYSVVDRGRRWRDKRNHLEDLVRSHMNDLETAVNQHFNDALPEQSIKQYEHVFKIFPSHLNALLIHTHQVDNGADALLCTLKTYFSKQKSSAEMKETLSDLKYKISLLLSSNSRPK